MENLKYIYKFFSAKKEYNFRSVENNEVFLTKYTNFNDPLEFNYEEEFFEAEEKVILKYIKDKKLIRETNSLDYLSHDEYNRLLSETSRYAIEGNHHDSFFDIMKTKSKELNKKINIIKGEFQKKITKEIKSTIKLNQYVCCFTDLIDIMNFKMWDSYANGHNGFCVQYKIPEMECTNKLIKIKYSDLPITIKMGTLYDFFYKNNDRQIRINLLKASLTKNMCWRDEKEYRLLSNKGGLKNSYEISNIICGLKMNDENIIRMKNICDKKGIGCYCIYKNFNSSFDIGTVYDKLITRLKIKQRNLFHKKFYNHALHKEIDEKIETYEKMNTKCPFKYLHNLHYFNERNI